MFGTSESEIMDKKNLKMIYFNENHEKSRHHHQEFLDLEKNSTQKFYKDTIPSDRLSIDQSNRYHNSRNHDRHRGDEPSRGFGLKRASIDLGVVSDVIDLIERGLKARLTSISTLIQKNNRDLKMAKKGFFKVRQKAMDLERSFGQQESSDKRLLSEDIKFFFNLVKQKSTRNTGEGPSSKQLHSHNRRKTGGGGNSAGFRPSPRFGGGRRNQKGLQVSEMAQPSGGVLGNKDLNKTAQKDRQRTHKKRKNRKKRSKSKHVTDQKRRKRGQKEQHYLKENHNPNNNNNGKKRRSEGKNQRKNRSKENSKNSGKFDQRRGNRRSLNENQPTPPHNPLGYHEEDLWPEDDYLDDENRQHLREQEHSPYADKNINNYNDQAHWQPRTPLRDLRSHQDKKLNRESSGHSQEPKSGLKKHRRSFKKGRRQSIKPKRNPDLEGKSHTKDRSRRRSFLQKDDVKHKRSEQKLKRNSWNHQQNSKSIKRKHKGYLEKAKVGGYPHDDRHRMTKKKQGNSRKLERRRRSGDLARSGSKKVIGGAGRRGGNRGLKGKKNRRRSSISKKKQPKRWERLYNIAIKKEQKRKEMMEQMAEVSEEINNELDRSFQAEKSPESKKSQEVRKLDFEQMSDDYSPPMESKRHYLRRRDHEASSESRKMLITPKIKKPLKTCKRANRSATPTKNPDGGCFDLKVNGESITRRRKSNFTLTRKSSTSEDSIGVEVELLRQQRRNTRSKAIRAQLRDQHRSNSSNLKKAHHRASRSQSRSHGTNNRTSQRTEAQESRNPSAKSNINRGKGENRVASNSRDMLIHATGRGSQDSSSVSTDKKKTYGQAYFENKSRWQRAQNHLQSALNHSGDNPRGLRGTRGDLEGVAAVQNRLEFDQSSRSGVDKKSASIEFYESNWNQNGGLNASRETRNHSHSSPKLFAHPSDMRYNKTEQPASPNMSKGNTSNQGHQNQRVEGRARHDGDTVEARDRTLIRSRERYHNLEERQNIAELISRTQRLSARSKSNNHSPSAAHKNQKSSKEPLKQSDKTQSKNAKRIQKQKSPEKAPQSSPKPQQKQNREEEPKKSRALGEGQGPHPQMSEFDECFLDPVSSSTRFRKTLLTKQGFLKMILPDASTLKDENSIAAEVESPTRRHTEEVQQRVSQSHHNSSCVSKTNSSKQRQEYTMASFAAEKGSLFAKQVQESREDFIGLASPQSNLPEEEYRRMEDQHLWRELEDERRRVVQLLEEGDLISEAETHSTHPHQLGRRTGLDELSYLVRTDNFDGYCSRTTGAKGFKEGNGGHDSGLGYRKDVAYRTGGGEPVRAFQEGGREAPRDAGRSGSNIFKKVASNAVVYEGENFADSVSSRVEIRGLIVDQGLVEVEETLTKSKGAEINHHQTQQEASKTLGSINSPQSRSYNHHSNQMPRNSTQEVTKNGRVNPSQNKLASDGLDELMDPYHEDLEQPRRQKHGSNNTNYQSPAGRLHSQLAPSPEEPRAHCTETSNSSNNSQLLEKNDDENCFSNFMSFKANLSNAYSREHESSGCHLLGDSVQNLGETDQPKTFKNDGSLQDGHRSVNTATNGSLNRAGRRGWRAPPKSGSVQSHYQQRKQPSSFKILGSSQAIRNGYGSSMTGGDYLSNSYAQKAISRGDYSEPCQKEILAAINLIKQVQRKTGLNLLDLCATDQVNNNTKILQTMTTSKADLTTASISQPIKEKERRIIERHRLKQQQSSLQMGKLEQVGTQDEEDLYQRIQRAKMFAKSAKALISTPIPNSGQQNYGYDHSKQQRSSQELYSQSTSAYLPQASSTAGGGFRKEHFGRFNSGNQENARLRAAARRQTRMHLRETSGGGLDRGSPTLLASGCLSGEEGQEKRIGELTEQDSISEADLMLQFSPQA